MDYIVETQFEGPGFVAVPNAVAQLAALSAEGLGVLVWLASLPKGFAIRRSSILSRFGFGKDKWQTVARALREVGALEVVKDRQADGTFASRYVVRWPDQERVATGAGKTGSGSTGSGEPAKVGRKIRQNTAENPAPYTEEKTNKGARASAPRPASRPASPAIGQAGRVASASGKVLDAESLSPFQRSRLFSGQSLFIEGVPVLPGSPEFLRLAQVARSLDAEKRATACA